MSMEAWEDRIFAFGRFLRSMMFFYLIIKICIGVFYRFNPDMVEQWFAHEIEFSNSIVLIFSPTSTSIDEMFGTTFAAIMSVFANIPIISTIMMPFAIFFALEHTLWASVFGPSATLLKDLLLVGVIVLFLMIMLRSKTKE